MAAKTISFKYPAQSPAQGVKADNAQELLDTTPTVEPPAPDTDKAAVAAKQSEASKLPPPDFRSYDGLAFLHGFFINYQEFLKDNPSATISDFLRVDATNPRSIYGPYIITDTVIIDELYDLTFINDPTEIPQNLARITARLGQATKLAKDVSDPLATHKPIRKVDLDDFWQKHPEHHVSYQGAISVLQIKLARVRARQFYESSQEYTEDRHEVKEITRQEIIEKVATSATTTDATPAEATVTTDASTNTATNADTEAPLRRDAAEKAYELIETGQVASYEELIEKLQAEYSPSLVEQVATAVTPETYHEVAAIAEEDRQITIVNNAIQQFQNAAESYVSAPIPEEAGVVAEEGEIPASTPTTTGTPPGVPATASTTAATPSRVPKQLRITGFYQQAGATKELDKKLRIELANLVQSGVIAPEVYERLQDKFTENGLFYIQTAVAAYAAGIEYRTMQQAFTKAIQQTVSETAPELDRKVIENIHVATPLFSAAMQQKLDVARAVNLLPDVAEDEDTETVLAFLRQLIILPTISQNVQLHQAIESTIETIENRSILHVGGFNPLWAIANDATFEEPIVSLLVAEELAQDQAELVKEAPNLPPEEVQQREAKIADGVGIASITNQMERVPALRERFMIDFIPALGGSEEALHALEANTTIHQITHAIGELRKKHKDSVFHDFVHFETERLRHSSIEQIITPFGFHGWKDWSKLYTEHFMKTYLANISDPEKRRQMENLLHSRWQYFYKHRRIIGFSQFLFTNHWVKRFAMSDHFVSDVIKYYRTKLALATGKFIFKSAKGAIVLTSKYTVLPVAKGVGGVAYRVGTPIVSALSPVRAYRFLTGKLGGAGTASQQLTSAQKFINSQRLNQANVPVGRVRLDSRVGAGPLPTPSTGVNRYSTVSRGVNRVTKPIGRSVATVTRPIRKNIVSRAMMAFLKKALSVLGNVLNFISKATMLMSLIKHLARLIKKLAILVSAWLYALKLMLAGQIGALYGMMFGAGIGGIAGGVAGGILGAQLATVLIAIFPPLVLLAWAIYPVFILLGAALGATIGAAILGTLGAVLGYGLQNFVLVNFGGASLVGVSTALVSLVFLGTVGWWIIPLAGAAFYLGAGAQWLLTNWLGPRFGLGFELGLSNAWNGMLDFIKGSGGGNKSSTKGAAKNLSGGSAGVSEGVGGAAVAGGGLLIAAAAAFALLPGILNPDDLSTKPGLQLTAPPTISNSAPISYKLEATFPQCSRTVRIENQLSSELSVLPSNFFGNPTIINGGVVKTINAVLSEKAITWDIQTNCSGSSATGSAQAVIEASSVSSIGSPYSLIDTFCQGANPSGCSRELKNIYEAAAQYANIPPGVIAGIANQEWKATFKHTDDEIVTWSQPGVKVEPNGPREHPRFIDGCAVSFAFAEGPMQFLTGRNGGLNVWGSYRNAAVEAGVRQQGYTGEACNVVDAIFGAAKKLKSNSGMKFASRKEQWEKEDVFSSARAYLGACVPNYNPNINYCESVWQYYRTFTPRKL